MFFIYYFCYGTSFAKVPWVYNSEINSIGWRTRGAAAATATNWINGFVTVQFTKPGVDHLGWAFYLSKWSSKSYIMAHGETDILVTEQCLHASAGLGFRSSTFSTQKQRTVRLKIWTRCSGAAVARPRSLSSMTNDLHSASGHRSLRKPKEGGSRPWKVGPSTPEHIWCEVLQLPAVVARAALSRPGGRCVWAWPDRC